MDQSRPLFVYDRSFIITISIIQIKKREDGVLGIRTMRPYDGRRRQYHGATYGGCPRLEEFSLFAKFC